MGSSFQAASKKKNIYIYIMKKGKRKTENDGTKRNEVPEKK